jgi:UDP-N-acetylmuramate dehydrogenase
VKAFIHENVALAPLTTFGIGGPARYFIDAFDEQSVLDAAHWAKDKDLPLFILGGGSNLLVADAGFQGLVVKLAMQGIEWRRPAIVAARAGENWDCLVGLAVERNLGGIECLSGIPGSVGGTPVQNVGAYGQEVSEVIASVRAYDRHSDRIVELLNEDCGFRYRTSIFNTTAKDRYVVLTVTFALTQDGPPAIRYPDVQREFEEKGAPPTLSAVRTAVRRIRQRKAMLLVEGDPDCRSAGSFFKNPIISERQFVELEAIAGRAGVKVPRYPASIGNVKIAAAWLIEQAGFSKGYSLGPVGLSSKHTLALVNKGDAKAEDVLRLAREIRTRVRDRFAIDLVPEPVLLGFPNEELL